MPGSSMMGDLCVMGCLQVAPKQVVVDLGFRGKEVDQANPGLEIIHRGRIKTLTQAQRRWLKRRPAVEHRRLFSASQAKKNRQSMHRDRHHNHHCQRYAGPFSPRFVG